MKTQIVHIAKLQTAKVVPAILRLAAVPAVAWMLAVLAAPAWAVELSGAIRSATGTLPPGMQVFGDRKDDLPAIVGKVDQARYRIELPDAGLFRIRLTAPGWDAAPKTIWDPKATGALDFLIYPAKVPEPALAAELIALGKQDQAVRPDVNGKLDPEAIERMNASDAKREQRMKAIVDAKGWPGVSMVGHEAASSAWLIVQHASPAFLKRCLPLMKAAAEKGEMAPSQLALSVDRDLMNDDKPQIYGSQLQWSTGSKPALYPIADREHVDQRRAAMGLEPLAQYLKHFEE